MFRYIITLLIFIAFLITLDAEENRIEIMAKELSTTGSTVEARGNVVIRYGDSVIQSSSAIYDRDTHMLTVAGGKTELLGFKGSKINSDKIQINTSSKKVTFKKIFLSDENDIWIYSNTATKQNGDITFGPSVISSCDVNRKDWSFYSGSTHYDSKARYVTLHDVKVKFWDVPVLYTPYFAFSTHKERSSGLLFPSLGYSKSEGAVYEQPIYWAPSRSWDLELRPQIRTIRGYGGYGTLRFVDSVYSSGAIRMGYFKDNEEYAEEYNLKNDSHYGFEMLYDSSHLLNRFFSAGEDVVDGLYINATLLNDIDYIYLQKKPMSHFGAVPLQESRLNYFAHNEDFSGGVFAKYFIDTRLEDNNSTMQILPTLQLHKYLKPILFDRLTYSLDLTANNYTREEGATLKVAEFHAPIEYTFPMMNDYVTLSLKEDLYYNTLLFGNGEFREDNYQYYNGISRIKLFSDLTKKYSNFVHVIQPSVTYSIPANPVESPVAFDELDEEQRKLFAPGKEEENIAFKFSQYFYDDDGDIRFFERLTQTYLPDREENNLGNLQHEIEYNKDEWKAYNSLVYNYEFNKIEEAVTELSWKHDDYSAAVSHSYQRGYAYDENHEVVESKDTNDINLRLGFKLTNRIDVGAGVVYNIDDEESTQYRLSATYDRECWNLTLGLRQDIRPIQASSGADSISDTSFNFQLNFVPFGGVGLSSNQLASYAENGI